MPSENLGKGGKVPKDEILEFHTDGKKSLFKDLRAKVLNAWKNNRQAEFKNENNGIVAQISNDGIGKMMSPKAVDKSIKNKFSKEAHFLGVENAGKLFEKAKFSHSEAARNQTPDIIAYHKYYTKAVFDGKPSNVKLTLKESIEAGHKIYSLELLEIE